MGLEKHGILKSREQKPRPTFLYFGPPKSGKSSAALTHSKPLVFDSEFGMFELSRIPENMGRKDATRDFFIVEVGDDIGLFMDKFKEMDADGLFSKKHDEIDTLIFDSATKIYECIKDDYQEEKEDQAAATAKKYNKPVDDSVFGKKIRMDEFGVVKRPLRMMMRTALNSPYVKVYVMHEAAVFEMNEKTKNMEQNGVTFKGEGSIMYDASVVVRTFAENGKYKGEVLCDRTLTYKPGTIIDNPGWNHWRRFYMEGGEEDTTLNTIIPKADRGDKTISAKVDALLQDKEVVEMFKAVGIPENGWRPACEKYNGDRNMVVGKLKARINDLSNQS